MFSSESPACFKILIIAFILSALFFLAVLGFAFVFSTAKDIRDSSEGISFSALPVVEIVGFSSCSTKLCASTIAMFEVIIVSGSTTIKDRTRYNFLLKSIKNCDNILI